MVGVRTLAAAGVALLALAAVVLFSPARGGPDQAYAQLPDDPEYYRCFDLPGPPPGALVNLDTQFGTHNGVNVGGGLWLCPPALKNDGGNLGLPEIRCYQINVPHNGGDRDLITQFGRENNVQIGNAVALCEPASQVVNPPGAPPPVPPLPRYVCYDAPGKDPPDLVDVATKFGGEPPVDVLTGTLLCVPALKGGDGDLGLPTLRCFATAGGGVPPAIVQVFTQFFPPPAGEGPGTGLAAPIWLCPQTKKLEVGGVAELPAEDGAAPLEASNDSSGLGVGAIAAIAAGGLVAAVALGAAGWYGRRRLTGP